MSSVRFAALLLAAGLLVGSALSGRASPEAPAARIVTLGDSITKGVRPGVKPGETFSSLLAEKLKAKGTVAEVVNTGIGGERTDQALARLERDVLSQHPRVVTVMYGTNDSYVDIGKQKSRITVDEYRANLVSLVKLLREHAAEPVLMTPPRWADDASPNGLGENPNVRLEPYVDACRAVAREQKVRLVDHYDHWTRAARKGVVLREWTTDGCHPNPRGHEELATEMLPVVRKALRK